MLESEKKKKEGEGARACALSSCCSKFHEFSEKKKNKKNTQYMSHITHSEIDDGGGHSVTKSLNYVQMYHSRTRNES